MPELVPPKVAVIGAGDIGCGWATLAVSRGWSVAIFDTDTGVLHKASDSIAERAGRLVAIGHADEITTRSGLESLRLARSLLLAVNEADWIIEATPEDLSAKQRALEHIEQVCRLKAVLASSTSGLLASDLCGRLSRPDRLAVIHPLSPVEFLPVVEIVPSQLSDPACVEDIRFWLTGLGRVPIVLQKEIPGGVVGRISAAVWRECIHLVLEGVVDVQDVDTAVEMGPSLRWSAAGPHLSHHLSAREQGLEMFLSNLLSTYEGWWEALAKWDKISAEDQHRLIKAVEKAYGAQLPRLRAARDTRLARMLNALSEEEPQSIPGGGEGFIE
ncbi:MAG: 3-hydroxyacyl-CoA dehydrogenase family protein [Gemmatimonadales bacterium]